MQPVIKWSGSKRSQSEIIKSFFPNSFNTYYEPFIGGGSMLYVINPDKAICGDICEPLIELWKEIRDNPFIVGEEYRKRWTKLQEEGSHIYYTIRENFNKTQSPYDLIFLSRTCTNGLIRFNSKGEFNNSYHITRKGIKPDSLEKIIVDWSNHIQNVDFFASDYIITTSTACTGDIIYLDPPYFHTKGIYYGNIDFTKFLNYIEDLNKRNIKYILSFDGKRGDKDYTVDIPNTLYKRHEFIPSGNSTFKKVMDKEKEQVFESIYLNY